MSLPNDFNEQIYQSDLPIFKKFLLIKITGKLYGYKNHTIHIKTTVEINHEKIRSTCKFHWYRGTIISFL